MKIEYLTWINDLKSHKTINKHRSARKVKVKVQDRHKSSEILKSLIIYSYRQKRFSFFKISIRMSSVFPLIYFSFLPKHWTFIWNLYITWFCLKEYKNSKDWRKGVCSCGVGREDHGWKKLLRRYLWILTSIDFVYKDRN